LTSVKECVMLLFKATMIDLSNYINVREAAKRLRIHEESLRRIIRIGTLPAEKIGGQWYIDKEQINIFAATYNVKTGKRKYII
jgi:excisionase family DNA binding protein